MKNVGHPEVKQKQKKGFALSTDLHKVGTAGSNFQDAECLELQEGETDAISLRITSNVPRYSLICTK